MMVEHRLQHAARELREVHIDVPPLGTPGPMPRRSRLQTVGGPLLVPLLFIAGGLVAVGATRAAVPPPMQSDIPAAAPVAATPADDAATPQPAFGDVTAPSLLDELEMIAGLVNRQSAVSPATPADEPTSVPPVSNAAGPI